jgi:teichuronic acid biosynthesis glycosyltransferase TuaG
MKSQPRISVVIPTYNRARELERALRSVLAQTYTNWEALVVDNHSSDNTDQVIDSLNDPRIKLLKIHNDGVIAASRNMGIANAQAEYVAFLDSDDWWSRRKLEISLRYLQGADAVYHDLYLVTRPGQRFYWKKARTRALKRPVFQDLIANGNALNNSSAVIRRSHLNAIKGLAEDRDLIGIEDYDLWLRLASVSERFERIPGALGYCWRGGGSVSNPQRTIKCLAAIEKRYPSLNDHMNAPDSAWFSYTKGRANYVIGSYENARRHLELVRWRAPVSTIVKTRWMRFWINVYRYSRP